jgi:hypothetical protein
MNADYTIFNSILSETKSKYVSYLVKGSDKEYKMTEIFSHNTEQKRVDFSTKLHFINGKINNHQLIHYLCQALNEKITAYDMQIMQIPQTLLHRNISAILLFINPVSIDLNDSLIMLSSIYITKNYIDDIYNDSNNNILKLMSKIKTPINDILTNTTNSEIIRKSSISIATIINDIIDLYKLKQNRMKITRSEVYIRQLLGELQEIVEFIYIVEDDVPEILYLDSKRIKQIILNMLNIGSQLCVSSSIVIDINDDDNDSFFYKIEFEVEKPEVLIEERLYITRRLVSLMGGDLSYDSDSVKFSIEACKDHISFSDSTLKKLKGKKILLLDAHSFRCSDIINKLKRWEINVIVVYTEKELYSQIETCNLLIIGNQDIAEKINKLTTKPYLCIIESKGQIRKNTTSNILVYPTDDIKLLNAVIDHII